MKTLEELFVKKFNELEKDNGDLKKENDEIKEKYQSFLSGEFIVINKKVKGYIYGTRDSKNYYKGILQRNNKDLAFAEQCLVDKSKLREFMKMTNGGSDYVCQLYEQEYDILRFMNKTYSIVDGKIKDVEMFLTQEEAYANYEDSVIEKLKEYIKENKLPSVEETKAD